MSSQDKNKNQPPRRVCLGKIVAAHGLKGLVKIRPFGEDVSLLSGTLYTSETGEDTLSMALKNRLGKYILTEIDGVQDRTQAESIRGTELYIERTVLPVIEKKGSYYYEDLVGLKAVDENGANIGEIIAVENYGAGELLEIKPEGGAESYLLPFTDDNVPHVDLDDQYVTIRNIEKYQI